MNCDSCRARFIDAMDFEKLASNIHFYPQLIKKYENKDRVENTLLQNDSYDKNDTLEEAIKSKDENTSLQGAFFDTPNKSPNNNIDSFYSKKPLSNEPKTVQMFDIPNSISKSQITKNIINTIFNEMPKIELPALKTIMQSKSKRMILATISIFLVLGSFALISINGVNEAVDEKRQMEAVEEYNSNDYPLEYDLPQNNNKAFDEYTIKQPVSTKPTYSPTITKVSWEASSELVKKEVFSKYLMMSGKNIKLNLQNDLLLINDVPTNGKAMVEVVLASNGSVLDVDIIESSGSRLVDDAIKKVVIDTLRRMKPPAINSAEPENSVVLKLILN
jgi:TonB family protein